MQNAAATHEVLHSWEDDSPRAGEELGPVSEEGGRADALCLASHSGDMAHRGVIVEALDSKAREDILD